VAESWKADGRLAKPGVVGTVMSNLGLERYLASVGITLVRTPVGDRYVLERMRSDGYNVGGEQSGHIILSDHTTTGDGLLAALQVLAVVKKQEQPVSKVCHRFDPLPQVLKNVRYKSGKPLENATVSSAIRNAAEHGRVCVGHQGRGGPPRRPWPAGGAAVRHRAGDPGDGRGRRQGAGRGGGRRDRRRLDQRGMKQDRGRGLPIILIHLEERP